MGFAVQYLDLILVPTGLLIMFSYHLYLFYKIRKDPLSTSIGFENLNRKAWVKRMMESDATYLNLALTVLSTNTYGAIYMATICLTLTSLIGALVGSSNGKLFGNVVILGDTSSGTDYLKSITMLVSFILAFASFVQSARCFVQANFYVSTPNTDLPVNLAQRSVVWGNYFWQIALRLLYFAMVFLVWSFGPIPMFVACVMTVVMLSFMDSNSQQLHHYRPLVVPAAKKVVEDVAAAIRETEQCGKLVVEEVASTFKAVEHRHHHHHHHRNGV